MPGKAVSRGTDSPRIDDLAARRSGAQVPRRLTVRPVNAKTLREQEAYRGPTWLDGIDPGGVKGTHGFGAAVALATTRRRRFLADLGFDPGSPATPGRLRSLERLNFGEELARRGEGRFMAKVPQRFSGQLETPKAPLASGQRVTIVRDPRSGSFVVLQRSAAHKDLVGKPVDLSRDQGGRIVARSCGHGLRR
jgi:Protein of unknown function (DUF3363)